MMNRKNDSLNSSKKERMALRQRAISEALRGDGTLEERLNAMRKLSNRYLAEDSVLGCCLSDN